MSTIDADIQYDTYDDAKYVNASFAEVVRMLEMLPAFFISFFLPGLDYATPWFHEDIFKRMTSKSFVRLLLAIPRGHAKTTLAKLAVVWHFLFSPYRFIIYVSNTSPIAKNGCRDIIEFLKCDNFVSTFGKIRMIKESESEGLWIFEIKDGKGKIKKCILRSAGANQQMRGINIGNERPQLAIVDDLEDLDNTGSTAQQEKLDNWVFRTFLKALARKSKVIWIGNMLTSTSLMARLAMRSIWNPVVFGSYVANDNGIIEPLWPDMWSMDALAEDFHEFCDLGKAHQWFCEMMNLPGQGINGFQVEQIKRMQTPNNDMVKAAFLTIDPAYGKDPNVHDKSAIVCHGIVEDVGCVVLEYFHDRVDETTLFEEATRMATKWNAWVWGVEGNATQSPLLALFELLKIKNQIQALEIFPLNPANRPKRERISAWVSAMAKGEYFIPLYDIEITNQLLQYNKTIKDQKDDLIDACAYGLDMLAFFLDVIIQLYDYAKNRHKNPKQTAQRAVEICNV